MAPCPEEVDVFTEPHTRMKTLVTSYSTMLDNTNFENLVDMESLLHELCSAFGQFKEHERIENEYIMKRLKAKLKALRIKNTVVCNCHSDSQLSDMIRLFERGLDDVVHGPSFERLHYGRSLREALADFNGHFLPHMQEEEEIFQPLLMKYFSYEELKELKMKVIEEHLARMRQGFEKRDRMKPDVSGGEVKVDAPLSCHPSSATHVHALPSEVMVAIFSWLSPKDLVACASVCTLWSDLAMDSSLWTTLCPTAWLTGHWSASVAEARRLGVDAAEEEALQRSPADEDDAEEYKCYRDEDADVDELCTDEDGGYPGRAAEEEQHSMRQQMLRERRGLTVMARHLFPRVGAGVKNLVLAGSKGLTSSLLRKMLSCCPNLELLDLSLTQIDDSAFKNLPLGRLSKSLKTLALAGCSGITDVALSAFLESSACCRERAAEAAAAAANRAGCAAAGYCPMAPSCPLLLLLAGKQPPQQQQLWESRWPLLLSYKQRGCCGSAASSVDALSMLAGIDNAVRGIEALQLPCMAAASSRGPPRLAAAAVPTTVKGKNARGPAAGGLIGMPALECLDLSGCIQLTDAGIRRLAPIPRLQRINLSGCYNLSGTGISHLVDQCNLLDPSAISYCDNIADGPFPNLANGCCNLGSAVYACCRSGN